MKLLLTSLAITGAMLGATLPLSAQATDPETPPQAVPALVAGVNLQIVLTTTGPESSRGPASRSMHSANFKISRLNTRDFIALLDDKYDLVAQPKDFDLVAVLVDTETENGYRFYLRNRKPNAAPAYVYLAPEVIGLSIDASALRYSEVQNGDVLVSGSGSFKHAVTVDSAGFQTQGIATGAYRVRDVAVGGVTARLEVPGAVQITTTGHYTENEGTPQAQSFIAETRWIFTAHRPVDLNDYPAPPPPADEPEPAAP